MLAELNISCCLVDHPGLFHQLHRRIKPDHLVVGAGGPEEFEGLGLTAELGPVVLLVPLGEGHSSIQYHMALPEAVLVDRALRDPDTLREALGEEPTRGLPRPPGDTVRRMFGSFGLSERQLEVLGRAVLGESSAEIASKLYISNLTVRNHLHAIYQHLGVSGRRELLGRFVRGLIEAGHA